MLVLRHADEMGALVYPPQDRQDMQAALHAMQLLLENLRSSSATGVNCDSVVAGRLVQAQEAAQQLSAAASESQ